MNSERMPSVLAAISAVNRSIVLEREEEVLLNIICNELFSIKNYLFAGIARKDNGNYRLYSSTNDNSITNNINVISEKFIKDIKGEVSGKDYFVFNRVNNADFKKVFFKEIAGLVINLNSSVFCLRLYHNSINYGWLFIVTEQDNIQTDEELDILEGIAGDISFAIHHMIEAKKMHAVELLYKFLSDNSPIGVFSLNKELCFEYFNEKAFRIFSKSSFLNLLDKDSLFGSKFLSYCSEKSRNLMIEEISKLNEDKLVSEPIEIEIENKGNKKIFAQVIITRIFDEIGSSKFIGQIIDVTEVKNAQEKVTESEAKYRTLAETANDSILLVDTRTLLITYANRIALDTLGYSESQIKSLRIDEVVSIKGSINKLFFEESSRFEGVFVASNNKKIPIEITKSFFSYKSKETNMLLICRDLSERKKLEEDREKTLQRERKALKFSETLRKATLALVSKNTLEDVLDEILNLAFEIVNCSSGNIAIIQKGMIRNVKVKGYKKYNVSEYVANISISLDSYPNCKKVVLTKKPYIVSDTLKEPFWKHDPKLAWIKSNLTIPLIVKGKVYGLLRLDSDIEGRFNKEDTEKLVPLASAAAIAIENAKILENLRKEIAMRKIVEEKLLENREILKLQLDRFIYAVSKIIEVKDIYVAGHQRNVSIISEEIAKKIGLPEKEVYTIKIASLLHDLGKIYVPSEILSKPSKLTTNEYEIIKTHPLIAYEIIKQIGHLEKVAKIILQHHERLNGSGYPNHLKDDSICIGARIIAVADVFDAMVSHRPYRPALGKKAALEELVKNRGTIYDAIAVDALVEIINKGIIKQYWVEAFD